MRNSIKCDRRITWKLTALLVLLISAVLFMSGCQTSAEKQEEAKEAGIQAMNKGDYKKAVEMFDEALKSSEGTVSGDEIDICLYKAAAQYNMDDIKGAIKTYDALIEFDDKDPNPYFLRGSVYLKAGEKTAGLDDYKEAIKRDEKNYDLYIAIYENLKKMNFEKEGEEFLNIALEKSGDSAEDSLGRGRIYTLLKQYDAAVTAFEKAYDKGQEDAKIYLADMYLAEGKEDKCDKILDELKDEDNLSSLACNAIASMELKRGNPEEALAYVNMGLDKFSVKNKRDLLKNRVAAYEYMGQFNEAYTYAMEFLQQYPQDVDMAREVKFLSTRV